MKIKQFLTAMFVLLFVATSSLYAQMGGMGGGMSGGRGGMGGGMGGPQPSQSKAPDVDLVATTGLFLIDVAPILKKCKIRDKAKIDILTDIIVEYQEEHDRIAFEFTSQVDMLIELGEGIKDNTIGEEEMRASIPVISEAVKAIRAKTGPMHQRLNIRIADEMNLDEKEARMWRIYYRNLCEDKMYRATDQPRQEGEGERPSGGPGGGGPGGGGGGRGGGGF